MSSILTPGLWDLEQVTSPLSASVSSSMKCAMIICTGYLVRVWELYYLSINAKCHWIALTGLLRASSRKGKGHANFLSQLCQLQQLLTMVLNEMILLWYWGKGLDWDSQTHFICELGQNLAYCINKLCHLNYDSSAVPTHPTPAFILNRGWHLGTLDIEGSFAVDCSGTKISSRLCIVLNSRVCGVQDPVAVKLLGAAIYCMSDTLLFSAL